MALCVWVSAFPEEVKEFLLAKEFDLLPGIHILH
jgi:hypothetical protein